jgi:hypothetical protein
VKELKKSLSKLPGHLISKTRDMMTLDTTTEVEEEMEGKSSAKTPGFPWKHIEEREGEAMDCQVYSNGCQRGCGGDEGDGGREG